jgi:hypothetical protein
VMVAEKGAVDGGSVTVPFCKYGRRTDASCLIGPFASDRMNTAPQDVDGHGRP